MADDYQSASDYESLGLPQGRRLKGPRGVPSIHKMERAEAVPRSLEEVLARLPGAELKPAELTTRQKLANWMMGGDRPSLERETMVKGLVGSDGLSGDSSLSLADAVPFLGTGLDLEEIYRQDGLKGVVDESILNAMPFGLPMINKAGRKALRGYAGGGKVLREIGEEAAEKVKGAGRKAAQELAAPAVKRQDTPLFDYDKLYEVPDVPQSELPRYEPKKGTTARVQDVIDNKEVQQELDRIVDKGIGMGGREWYNTDQLRQRFVGELGEEAGNQAFRRYMDYVAGTSPRSKVKDNARNASFYYMLDQQGLPLPEKNPQPYGHMAQKLHRGNAENIRETGGWDVFKNPKPASFVENLVGNQMPVTVDAHAFKLPGILARDPRFLATSYQWTGKDEAGNKVKHAFKPRQMFAKGEISMDDAIRRPAFFDAQPGKPEYAALEDMYQGIAQRKGITPAQVQASAWVGGGDITELGSTADPFLKVFEDRVRLTSEKTGKSPESVLREFIRGNLSLFKKGGKVSSEDYGSC